MHENKTRPTPEGVTAFLDSVADDARRRDCYELVGIMRTVTGEEPVMWGTGIVGFGSYHYRYATGREGDMPVLSFSPRKKAITIYGLLTEEDQSVLLNDLGPHKQGKGCLYITSLSEVRIDTLTRLMKQAKERLT